MVPNAEVVVTSDETGVKQKTTTNLQGNWIAQFLIPGRYGFTVTAAGFKQALRSGSGLAGEFTRTRDHPSNEGGTSNER